MPENSQSKSLAYQPKTKGYSFRASDTSAPTAPPPEPVEKSKPEQGSKEKMNPFALLALEILGLVAVFIVFLLILNFFNIISLRSIYPNQLGWLPHLKQTASVKPITQNQNTNTKVPKAQPTIGYNTMATTPMGICPLPAGCKNAVQIGNTVSSASQDFSGLGFTLTGSQSAILAMREGKISMENTIENGENLTVVTITAPANIQKYVYKFKSGAYSTTMSSGNVKQGQKIGDLKNSSTLTYQSKSYSFIFYMYVLVSKKYPKLQSSIDGLTIESPNK